MNLTVTTFPGPISKGSTVKFARKTVSTGKKDANGHYKSDDRRDTWYANRADEEKAKLDNLKSMDRDDIIRKYNDLSTDEALQKHKEDITKTEENIADYTKDAKRADERYQQSLNSAKDTRRDATYSRLRTSTPKNKADSAVDYR